MRIRNRAGPRAQKLDFRPPTPDSSNVKPANTESLAMFLSFNARALGLTLSVDETLRIASEAGFGGVDLMVRDALEQGVELGDTRRKMDDLGLKAGAFPFPFDWRGDEATYREGLRRLPAIAEAATVLNLKRTGTWVMPECPEGMDRSQTEVLHVERLQAIASELDRLGIRLGLEVIGVESSRPGRNVPYVTRLDQLEGLLFALSERGNSNVGIVADAWHLYAANEPVAHALAQGVEKIILVHIADLPIGDRPDRSAMVDAVRGLPGEHGAVESERLLRTLKSHSYDGPVMAEPLARCRSLAGLSPLATAHAAARSLKALWPE